MPSLDRRRPAVEIRRDRDPRELGEDRRHVDGIDAPPGPPGPREPRSEEDEGDVAIVPVGSPVSRSCTRSEEHRLVEEKVQVVG